MKGFMVDVVFAQRVARFIRYDSSTKKYDEIMMKIFVDKVGISITIAVKWATGAASPPPMKKKITEEFLDSYEAGLKQRPK